MSDFANRQLPKALLKNYQAWSVGAFWVLPDKETVTFCRQLHMHPSGILQATLKDKRHVRVPQCEIFRTFGTRTTRFVFSVPELHRVLPKELLRAKRAKLHTYDRKMLDEWVRERTGFALSCVEHGPRKFLEHEDRIKIGTSVEIVEEVYNGIPIISFDLPDLNFICGINSPSDFEKASRKLATTLILLFTGKFRQLESFGPTQPKLDTNVYQVVDLLLTTFIHCELLNPDVFKPQKWPGTASVGGIAASSPEHALSLLSVRLSASGPFLPAGLSGESMSDSKRQKHYSRGDGADASATI